MASLFYQLAIRLSKAAHAREHPLRMFLLVCSNISFGLKTKVDCRQFKQHIVAREHRHDFAYLSFIK